MSDRALQARLRANEILEKNLRGRPLSAEDAKCLAKGPMDRSQLMRRLAEDYEHAQEESARNNLVRVEQEREQTAEEARALEASLRVATTRVAELEQKQSGKEQAAREQQLRADAALHTANAALAREQEGSRRKQEELQALQRRLEHEIANAADAVAKKTLELEEEKRQAVGREMSQKHALDRASRCDADLQAEKTKLVKFQQDLTRCQEELRQTQLKLATESASLHSKSQEASERLALLTAQNATCVSDSETKEKEVTRQRAELARQQTDLEALRTKEAKLQSDIAKLQTDMRSRTDELQEQQRRALGQEQTKTQSAEGKNRVYEQELQRLLAVLSPVQAELAQCKGELRTKEAALSRDRESLRVLLEEQKVCLGDLEAKSKEVAKQQAEFQSVELALRAEIAKVKAEVASKTQDLQREQTRAGQEASLRANAEAGTQTCTAELQVLTEKLRKLEQELRRTELQDKEKTAAQVATHQAALAERDLKLSQEQSDRASEKRALDEELARTRTAKAEAIRQKDQLAGEIAQARQQAAAAAAGLRSAEAQCIANLSASQLALAEHQTRTQEEERKRAEEQQQSQARIAALETDFSAKEGQALRCSEELERQKEAAAQTTKELKQTREKAVTDARAFATATDAADKKCATTVSQTEALLAQTQQQVAQQKELVKERDIRLTEESEKNKTLSRLKQEAAEQAQEQLREVRTKTDEEKKALIGERDSCATNLTANERLLAQKQALIDDLNAQKQRTTDDATRSAEALRLKTEAAIQIEAALSATRLHLAAVQQQASTCAQNTLQQQTAHEQRLQQATNEQVRLTAAIDSLRADLLTSRADLDTKAREATELESARADLKGKHEACEQRTSTENEQHRGRVTALERQIEESAKDRNSLRAKVSNLEQKVAAAVSETADHLALVTKQKEEWTIQKDKWAKEKRQGEAKILELEATLATQAETWANEKASLKKAQETIVRHAEEKQALIEAERDSARKAILITAKQMETCRNANQQAASNLTTCQQGQQKTVEERDEVQRRLEEQADFRTKEHAQHQTSLAEKQRRQQELETEVAALSQSVTATAEKCRSTTESLTQENTRLLDTIRLLFPGASPSEAAVLQAKASSLQKELALHRAFQPLPYVQSGHDWTLFAPRRKHGLPPEYDIRVEENRAAREVDKIITGTIADKMDKMCKAILDGTFISIDPKLELGVLNRDVFKSMMGAVNALGAQVQQFVEERTSLRRKKYPLPAEGYSYAPVETTRAFEDVKKEITLHLKNDKTREEEEMRPVVSGSGEEIFVQVGPRSYRDVRLCAWAQPRLVVEEEEEKEAEAASVRALVILKEECARYTSLAEVHVARCKGNESVCYMPSVGQFMKERDDKVWAPLSAKELSLMDPSEQAAPHSLARYSKFFNNLPNSADRPYVSVTRFGIDYTGFILHSTSGSRERFYGLGRRAFEVTDEEITCFIRLDPDRLELKWRYFKDWLDVEGDPPHLIELRWLLEVAAFYPWCAQVAFMLMFRYARRLVAQRGVGPPDNALKAFASKFEGSLLTALDDFFLLKWNLFQLAVFQTPWLAAHPMLAQMRTYIPGQPVIQLESYVEANRPPITQRDMQYWLLAWERALPMPLQPIDKNKEATHNLTKKTEAGANSPPPAFGTPTTPRGARKA